MTKQMIDTLVRQAAFFRFFSPPNKQIDCWFVVNGEHTRAVHERTDSTRRLTERSRVHSCCFYEFKGLPPLKELVLAQYWRFLAGRLGPCTNNNTKNTKHLIKDYTLYGKKIHKSTTFVKIV